jgi:cell division septum initiation protein DivIVA
VNSAVTSVLDAQVDAMLQRVRSHRERRAAEMRTATERQAAEIVQGARAEARQSLHRAVTRERARTAQGLRQAEARAELESRRRAQLETRALLGHMWEHIAEALEGRWRTDVQRDAWIAAAVGEAARLLTGQAWNIEHATGVSSEDRRRGEALARAAGATGVEWRLDAQTRAGLRVRAPGACLDATTEGLLAHREDIEAAFLWEYLAPSAQGPKP